MGSADLLVRVRAWRPTRPMLRLALPALLGVWAVASLGLAGIPPRADRWLAKRASLEIFHVLYREDTLCGVATVDVPGWETGGYTHLHA